MARPSPSSWGPEHWHHCVTAMISSGEANARSGLLWCTCCSTSLVPACGLVWFYLINAVVHFDFVGNSIDQLGIAVVHTTFNVLCTVLLFPFSGLLEKLACRLVRDDKVPEQIQILDERLLSTPPVAIGRCQEVAGKPWPDLMDAPMDRLPPDRALRCQGGPGSAGDGEGSRPV